MKNWIRAILITGTIAAFLSPAAKAAEKQIWPVTGTSTQVIKVWKVWDLERIEGWEEALERCPPCMEEAIRGGEFKLFRRMKREGYELFYAFAFEFPPDSGLVFDRYSKITMTAEAKGDSIRTVYLESDQIIFCIGWGSFYQVEERVNTEAPVYVRPVRRFGEPSSEDYEWVRFRDEKFPTYYVLGYARFPGLATTKIRAVINWQFTGVTSYSTGR